jgi:hypothetical protein
MHKFSNELQHNDGDISSDSDIPLRENPNQTLEQT